MSKDSIHVIRVFVLYLCHEVLRIYGVQKATSVSPLPRYLSYRAEACLNFRTHILTLKRGGPVLSKVEAETAATSLRRFLLAHGQLAAVSNP